MKNVNLDRCNRSTINQIAASFCEVIDENVRDSTSFFSVTGIKYARYKQYKDTGYGLSLDMIIHIAICFRIEIQIIIKKTL